METIKETLYNNNITKECERPFVVAIGIKDQMSQFGRIEEKENKVFTTEEGSFLVLKFDLVKEMDNVSKLVFSFDIKADVRRLYVNVIGFLLSTFDEKDKTFNDFYKLEMYSDVLDDAKKIANKIKDTFEKIVSEG